MKKVFAVILVLVISIAGFVFVQLKQFNAVTKGEKISEYKNPKEALLIIDIQKDLTQKDGKAVVNLDLTDKIIKNTNTIIDKADKNKILVIYIKHEFKKGFLVNMITKGALAEGSEGAQSDPRLRIINDNIFIKNKIDAFSNPGLDEFLRKNEVRNIDLAGIDAEASVDKTLKAALDRNYSVTVLSDCIATKNEKRLSEKLAEFSKLGAGTAASGDILANIRYDRVSYGKSSYR